MAAATDALERITLQLDNKARLEFRGRLFSEAVWTDEDSGVSTHHKLYVTDRNEQVYVIGRSGSTEGCRAYRVTVYGDRCVVSNGRYSMELPLDMLLLAVRTLCGTSDAAVLAQAEEMLRAANA